MHTNELSAFGTCPSVCFLLNELSDADLLYALKIIDHAHTIVFPVTCVEVAQLVAGVFIAIEAKLQMMCYEDFARFYPAKYSGLRLPTIIAPAPRARILFPDIGAADAAVHAAGGDQV
jgi:hypothetical protein